MNVIAAGIKLAGRGMCAGEDDCVGIFLQVKPSRIQAPPCGRDRLRSENFDGKRAELIAGARLKFSARDVFGGKAVWDA
jgi:hypothetical protein